jgi:DNA primase
MFADLNSDALRFQELYYNERKHIAHLDDQRRAGFEELVAYRAQPPLDPALDDEPRSA